MRTRACAFSIPISPDPEGVDAPTCELTPLAILAWRSSSALDQPHQVDLTAEARLGIGVADVDGYRLGTDPERVRQLLERRARGEQADDLALARLGYMSLRPVYQRTVGDPLGVRDAILELVRRYR